MAIVERPEPAKRESAERPIRIFLNEVPVAVSQEAPSGCPSWRWATCCPRASSPIATASWRWSRCPRRLRCTWPAESGRRKATCPCTASRRPGAPSRRFCATRGARASPARWRRRRASTPTTCWRAWRSCASAARAATPARACTAAGWARRARTSCCWCARTSGGTTPWTSWWGRRGSTVWTCATRRCSSRGASAARWPSRLIVPVARCWSAASRLPTRPCAAPRSWASPSRRTAGCL